jgi:hypothetical protein
MGVRGSLTGSNASGRGGGYVRRRRTRVGNEKKIADDEFMAAAIGDVEWLRQSLRESGSQINHDKNVSDCNVLTNLVIIIFIDVFLNHFFFQDCNVTFITFHAVDWFTNFIAYVREKKLGEFVHNFFNHIHHTCFIFTVQTSTHIFFFHFPINNEYKSALLRD